MEIKYFDIEKKDKKLMFMNFPTILKWDGNKLEIISSKHQEELNGIEFTQDREGEYLVNPNYAIEKITEIDAKEKIRKTNLEYGCWNNYFSTSDNVGSSDLFGSGGEQLA